MVKCGAIGAETDFLMCLHNVNLSPPFFALLIAGVENNNSPQSRNPFIFQSGTLKTGHFVIRYLQ